MNRFWEPYGLFIEGVWTTLDDVLFFVLLLGGFTLVTIAFLLSGRVEGMRIMMGLGFLLWTMLIIYVQELRRKVIEFRGF